MDGKRTSQQNTNKINTLALDESPPNKDYQLRKIMHQNIKPADKTPPKTIKNTDSINTGEEQDNNIVCLYFVHNSNMGNTNSNDGICRLRNANCAKKHGSIQKTDNNIINRYTMILF